MDFALKYERPNFHNFLQHHLLPEDFELKTEENKTLYFKPERIKNITLLGKSESLNLNVYEAEHESENDPRVSLSREIFRTMSEFGARRALVILKSVNSDNYRLSLATVELKPEGSKVRKEYSNPRRYSFFLGPEAKVKTPERFLLNKGRVKDFDDLALRFSIEVVNKEFYNAIARSFSELVGGLRKDGSKTKEYKASLKLPSKELGDQEGREFAVRLIGRIVFCWFLKKKTSNTGKTLIPEQILSLNAVGNNKEYYHSILEPLFFEVLNTPVDDREKEYKAGNYKDIPFLNGGLFEDHPKDYYWKSNERSVSYLHTLKIPDKWFAELFETLETYNFTIDENTTVDVDLSIDPEMLGRIFENLLAELNPETEESARKSTGSYYTPRPIVEYMVNESLKQYLLGYIENSYLPFSTTGFEEKDKQHHLFINDEDNVQQDFSDVVRSKIREKIEQAVDSLLSFEDETAMIAGRELSDEEKTVIIEALDKIKIIDPACGSGAFPMGILHKMVTMLQKVDPDSKKWLESVLRSINDPTVRDMMRKKLENEKDLWDYTRKIGIIRKSIYGIDIQPIVVEIAKLRCFLSLIVEENVIDEEENRNIEPLPNLDFKFVCANSLIDVPKEDDGGMFGDGFFERLEQYIQDYFLAYKSEHKKELHGKIEELIDRKVDEKESSLKALLNKGFYKEYSKLDKKDKGNVDKLQREAQLWESYKNIFKDQPVEFFNIKYFFPEVSKKGGFDIVIGNPPYAQLQTDKGKLASHYRESGYETFISTGDIYCLFYEKANQILRKNGTACFITSNKWMKAAYGEQLRKYFKENTQPIRLIDVGPGVFDTATVDTNILLFTKRKPTDFFQGCVLDKKIQLSLEEYIKEHSYKIEAPKNGAIWEISSLAKNAITKKIEANGTPLKDWNIQIFFGIKTGFNDAFIIDEAKRKELIKADPKSKEIIKPLLRGRDIQRYSNEWAGLYLIQTGLEVDIPTLFPVVYNHLLQFEEKARNRDDQGQNWWNLRACTYYSEFEKEKIIWKRIGSIMRFSYDNTGTYCLDSTCIATGEKIKFLTGVLNSKVCLYELTRISPKTGTGDNIISVQALEPLRVPVPNENQEKAVTDLVDLILACKAKDPNADTSELEQKIDRMVYRLYGLTDEEVKIVEEK